MRILLDTNVLLRLADNSHPLHTVAAHAIRTLQSNGDELVLVPQVLYEFWAVTTRTVNANGLGESPSFANALIIKFCHSFRLLRDERAIYEAWFELVFTQQISGVKSYDARLAAAMQRHEITHFLTFNAADFRRYSHITVINPLAV